MMKRTVFLGLALGAFASSQVLADSSLYVSGSAAYNDMDDTGSVGWLTDEFVTGPGTEVPAGVVLGPGTNLRWDTDVDSGWGVNLALGWRANSARFELEYAYTENDVDSHSGVTIAGIAIDSEDAAILISDAEENLGVTVGDLVADGGGEFTTDYFFVNAYYDFDGWDDKWAPYVGVGLGWAWLDADYSPSSIDILDDDDDGYAWQAMLGLNYFCSDQLSIFGGVRWRESDEMVIRTGSDSLVPALFEVDNENWQFEVGVRWHFHMGPKMAPYTPNYK